MIPSAGVRLFAALPFRRAAGRLITAAYPYDGKLQVVLDRTYPLADAAKAQSALERGEIAAGLALDIFS